MKCEFEIHFKLINKWHSFCQPDRQIS